MILEFVFIISTIIQVAYYIFIFDRFVFSTPKKITTNNLPISIIICAKNEVDNLVQFLPFLIQQNYTNFELVLVNDHSTDNTLKIMQTFKSKYSNIQIVDVTKPQFSSNKKNAITQGIKAAKYEHLLFTDADCKPNSSYWISEMAAHFNAKKTIVLGYGAYQKISNSWLNKLIRFETLVTAIQYFSYTKIGLPYMGVGRNIAYTKTQFYNANGFVAHQHIKSGDDDLLVNQIATKNNTSCCYTPNSFTTSKPHTSFKKWFYQKRRHLSTAILYKPIHQLLLSLFYITQVLFWLMAIALLISSSNWKFVLQLFLLKTVLQYVIFSFSAKKLSEKDLIIFIPFLELFLVIMQMCIFIANLISKPKEWS